MKKISFALIAIAVTVLLGISAFADETHNIGAVQVEDINEILNDDEMQIGSDSSYKASFYSFLDGEAEGDGTQENPYRIYNADDLVSFAEGINSGSDTDRHYLLMDNIDLGGMVWEPVGFYTAAIGYETCFSGVFDGNGYTVSNFVINSASSAYVGFFGFVNNGTVKNLTLSDFEISIDEAQYSAIYVGGIAGRCIANSVDKSILIENCKTENAGINISAAGSIYMGGLAGYVMSGGACAPSYVRNCESGTDVFALSLSSITGTYTVYAGGLIGYTGATEYTSLSIEKCMSYGSVEATTAYDIERPTGAFGGGLFGIAGVREESDLDINGCYSISPVYVECTSAGSAGGFAAQFAGDSGKVSVRNCYAIADASCITYGITSDTNYMLSGTFAGAAANGADISGCFVSGSVADLGSPDSYVGPMLGYNFGGTLNNCYYPDSITLVGINRNYDGAKAVTAENATNPETYTGFDFENVWKIYEEGYKYPVLRDIEHIFRITFISRGKLYESNLAKYGDSFVFPVKNPDTYSGGPTEFVFSHWSLTQDGEAINEDANVIDSHTLYAVFEEKYKSFDFVFMNGNDVYDTQSVTYGETTLPPSEIPEKASDVNFWYRFKYWSITPDGTDKTPVSEIVADKKYTFYAIYDAFDYNVWNGQDAREFSAGNGTKERPFEIRSGQELYYLARGVNGGNKDLAGAYYELCADIDLADNEWLPIGEKDNEFCGVFYGNGYTVRNMSISKGTAAGLFGYVIDAEISGVVIDNANVDIDNAQNSVYAGILSAYASNSTISQIGITNSVLSVSAQWSVDAGTVAGRVVAQGTGSETVISDCYSDTEINISVMDISDENEESRAYAGQIIGRANSFDGSPLKIMFCYGLGEISARADMAYSGGIVGAASDYEATDSTAISVEGCFVSTQSIRAEGITCAYAGNILGFIENEVEINKVYSLSGIVVEAQSQTEEGVSLLQGETAEADELRNTEFLAQNLGFDFDTTWHFEDEYSYPVLVLQNAEKPEFSVLNVKNFSGNVTLEADVCVTGKKPYRVTLSAYSERGRLIGIKTVTVSDNSGGNLEKIPMALENVRDTSYIKVTVLDEETRSLLFPSVYKKL